MEWITLIILVPAILLPVVLLFGFSGCSSFGTDLEDGSVPLPGTSLSPTALRAVLAVSRDGIVLTWLNQDPGAVNFQLERRIDLAPASDPPIYFDTPTTAAILVNPLASGLSEGTTYVYRVRSRRSDGSLTNPPSPEAKATLPPAPPTDVVAAGADVDRIELTWKNGSTRATRFLVEHRVPGGTFASLGKVTGTLFSHGGLAEGSQHEYRVTALVDGFDDSLPIELASVPSAVAAGTPLVWKTAYSIPLTPAVAQGRGGNCVVQRINAPLLTQSGSFVRVTLRGLPNATARLSVVTISNANPVGGAQPWDSASPPLPLTFGGVAAVALQAGVPQTSDKVKFKITAGSTQDVHIAMNVDPTSQNLLTATANGPRHYFKVAAAEATAQDRSAGYTTVSNQVCLVEKIEVA